MILSALALAATLAGPARATPSAAFDQLRAIAPEEARNEALAPAIAVPEFSQPAVVETGSSANGIPDRIAALSSLGTPLVSIPIAQSLNNLWKSAAQFPAGDRQVHVFGAKAQNNDVRAGWYVGFYVDGDAQPTFLNAMQIVHFSILTHRHKVITLNGRPFDIRLDIPLLEHNPDTVKLSIQSRATDNAKYVFTLTDTLAGIYSVGYPLQLGGRDYRVILSQDFLDNHGAFGGFTQDVSIVLMFKDGKNFSGFHRFLKNVPTDDRALITTPQKSLPVGDGWLGGDVTLGLHLQGNSLEVFYPVPAAGGLGQTAAPRP